MADTYGGFVYRFTHIKENSPLADDNWYYVRDDTACFFANGQLAMTVEDLNDKQFLLEDEEFEGPRMRFHKEGLEVDGVQIKTCGIDYIWPTELNSFMRICDQDTGEWYQYCVTTETMLRNTKMTARFEGEGVHYIQTRILDVGTGGRSMGTYLRLPYEQDGPEFSVTKGTLASPGFWVRNKGKQDITVNGNILTAEFVCKQNSCCTTAVGVPVVVEFSSAHALKLTIDAFTPPERILEGGCRHPSRTTTCGRCSQGRCDRRSSERETQNLTLQAAMTANGQLLDHLKNAIVSLDSVGESSASDARDYEYASTLARVQADLRFALSHRKKLEEMALAAAATAGAAQETAAEFSAQVMDAGIAEAEAMVLEAARTCSSTRIISSSSSLSRVFSEATSAAAHSPETGRKGDSKGSSQAATPEDTKPCEEAQSAQTPETHNHPGAMTPMVDQRGACMYHPDLGYVGDGPPETEAEAEVFARCAHNPEQEIVSPLASSHPRKSILNRILTIMEAETEVHSPTLLDLSVLQSRAGTSWPLPLFASLPGCARVSSTSSASSSRSMRQTVGFRPMDLSSSQGVHWGYWGEVRSFEEVICSDLRLSGF